jgi:hypothetical protein
VLPEPTLASVDWASARDATTVTTAMAAKSRLMTMSFTSEVVSMCALADTRTVARFAGIACETVHDVRILFALRSQE